MDRYKNKIEPEIGTVEWERQRARESAQEHTKLEQMGWPWELIKAVNDPFQYAAGLRSGQVVVFHYAEPEDTFCNWVRLHFSGAGTGIAPSITAAAQENGRNLIYFERGMCVRVSDITWVVDDAYTFPHAK